MFGDGSYLSIQIFAVLPSQLYSLSPAVVSGIGRNFLRSVSDSSTFDLTIHVDSSRQSLAFGFTHSITFQRFTRLPVNSSR
jgi:hypothetical protein